MLIMKGFTYRIRICGRFESNDSLSKMKLQFLLQCLGTCICFAFGLQRMVWFSFTCKTLVLCLGIGIEGSLSFWSDHSPLLGFEYIHIYIYINYPFDLNLSVIFFLMMLQASFCCIECLAARDYPGQTKTDSSAKQCSRWVSNQCPWDGD